MSATHDVRGSETSPVATPGRPAGPVHQADRRDLSAEEAEGCGLDPTGRSGLTAWGTAETVVLGDGATMVGVVVARP